MCGVHSLVLDFDLILKHWCIMMTNRSNWCNFQLTDYSFHLDFRLLTCHTVLLSMFISD